LLLWLPDREERSVALSHRTIRWDAANVPLRCLSVSMVRG
jgi:hypothetical protein